MAARCAVCGAEADVREHGSRRLLCRLHQPLGEPGRPGAAPLYRVRRDFPDVVSVLAKESL